jgi:hypothetical protein
MKREPPLRAGAPVRLERHLLGYKLWTNTLQNIYNCKNAEIIEGGKTECKRIMKKPARETKI